MENIIGKTVTVKVDRPLGTYHPNHSDIFYSLNYGYVEGIIAGDGEYQDAYIIGIEYPVEKFTGKIIAVIKRENDIEDKWVVAPLNKVFSESEIAKSVYFQEKYFKSKIIT